MMKHKLLALAFAAGCHLHAQAIEPRKSQTLNSPDQVPEGLSAADWSSIRGAYSAGHATKAATVISQQAYLKAGNSGAGDSFGTSVAVSGDTVVVGASYENSSTTGVNSVPNELGNSSGAAYVFVRNRGIWTQQAYLKASNAGSEDYFGSSVAISGETIVVGANGEDSNGVGVNGSGQANNSASESGAVYVFTRSGGTWSQQAYLKASNTGVEDYFGGSVSVSGDTIIVGAYQEDSSTVGVNSISDELSYESGAAYVFTRSGGIWLQQAYLKASNTGLNDYFGCSVAVSGETIVIGAQGEASNALGVNGNEADNSNYYSGAAYVFTRSGGMWLQQAYLKASNNEQGDNFGTSVAVSGETVVVGAYGEDSHSLVVNGNEADNSADESGAAYVFTRSGVTWSQQAYLKASNSGSVDYFGNSVAVSGDTVVVGAQQEASNAVGVNGSNQADNSASESGAAYVFTRSGSTWSQQMYLKASNTEASDYFGSSVAVSGGTIISGAPSEDGSNAALNSTAGPTNNSGAAYIYSALFVEPVVVKFKVSVKVSSAKFGKVTGMGSFETGSKVTLSAKAKRGHTFVGWYEKKKLINKKKMLVIKKITANRSLVAKFK